MFELDKETIESIKDFVDFGPPGLSQKEQEAIKNSLDRIVDLHRLYTGYFNTDQPPSVFAEEFFFAVGEILENGKRLEDLELKHVRKEEL